MHEMSIAAAIVSIALQTLEQQNAPGLKLRAVHVEIGALSQIDSAALNFCFEVVVKHMTDTSVALELSSVPGRGWCMVCAKTVALPQLGAACPECGCYQVQATQGTEMRVIDIEVTE